MIACGCEQVVELAEERGLDLDVLDDRFDDEIASGKVGDAGRRLDTGDRRIALGLRQLPFFDEFVERFGDRGDAAAQRLLGDLHQHDVETGGGAGLRDAVAHQAGAADADRSNLDTGVPFAQYLMV